MADLILYYGMDTCARVTMNALEEIGLEYAAKFIDLSKEEQKSSAYTAINPNAEVPALIIDGRTLTQNPAILHYLHARHPAADLLPHAGSSVGINEPLENLMWCSNTLHILRRQLIAPARFTAGDLADVRTKGMEGWFKVLPSIEARLANGPWWYGDQWSIVDVYLNWAYSGLVAHTLDIANRPVLYEHEQRLHARPSYVRALARERAATK